MSYSIYVFFPVMVIGSIIYINIMLKPIAKFVVIGYLILIVGVASVPIGISFIKIMKKRKKSNKKMNILAILLVMKFVKFTLMQNFIGIIIMLL